jgi:hypothetical protein
VNKIAIAPAIAEVSTNIFEPGVFALSGAKMIEVPLIGQGHTTPGGRPKDPSCTICNLRPVDRPSRKRRRRFRAPRFDRDSDSEDFYDCYRDSDDEYDCFVLGYIRQVEVLRGSDYLDLARSLNYRPGLTHFKH